MAGEEYVTLVVGGQRWTARERITVQYAAKQAARQFAFTATDATTAIGDAFSFMPGDPVQVMAGDDLILDGYIDKMTPSYEAKNHKIECSGRSKSKDSVDSSHDHEKSELRNKTVIEIAKELDQQGVQFKTDQSLQPIKLFRLHTGETVFAAVERATRQQGLILQGEADGSILITKGSQKRVHPALIEGKNILGASATFDESQQHSEIKVKGQKAYGAPSKSTLRISQSATNSKVKRNRKKVIASETDTDDTTAKKRAENHRDKQMGESITASIKVQGWRDDNGQIWQINTLVDVFSPMLKLNEPLTIMSVNLSQDSAGTFAQLELAHPKALGGDGGKSGGSAPSKSAGSSSSKVAGSPFDPGNVA